jgi:hypothetical protein
MSLLIIAEYEARYRLLRQYIENGLGGPLSAGNKKTARKHAWRAFCHLPFAKKNLVALLCAIRGY